MNNEIKKILNNINFENNKLIKINKNLYLTQNQINILKNYNIEYKNSTSIRDLMIKIEEYIDYNYEEELDNLLYMLSEQNYYLNTNK